ncbi:MAG: lipocalin family protein [Verrucomicrobia bacterium]|nr:lipocalin family protein [Verrucomicrobiota bacterium]MDA1065632.1 lipocalin family protein [Verrucomicrobiota bacterium]
MNKLKTIIITLAMSITAILTGCKTYENLPEMAANVDINRFMGTWYVHGYTPTMLDRNAYNATESYELDDNSRILTTYRFRKGGFDGPIKTYHPVGKVVDSETNAEWKMRFFTVISAPYLVLYVDSDYSETLVGHPNLKMAWLMSRSPEISETRYAELVQELKDRNFNLTDFVQVPQRWDEPR